MKNNRQLAVIVIIAVCLLAFVIFNPGNILIMVNIVESVAVTALCVVATVYLAKRL